MTPFLKKLNAVKEVDHVVSGHALIRSYPGCKKQALHTDYFSMLPHARVRGVSMPYSCLVALESGSYVYLNDSKMILPKGSAVVFRGDVVHSGAEYSADNIRYHLYIDVRDKHVASEGTHVHWV